MPREEFRPGDFIKPRDFRIQRNWFLGLRLRVYVRGLAWDSSSTGPFGAALVFHARHGSGAGRFGAIFLSGGPDFGRRRHPCRSNG